MQGTIIRLVSDKGFGFIEANGVDYFFHRSSVRNANFSDLRVGARVKFDASEHPDKGPRAENIQASA